MREYGACSTTLQKAQDTLKQEGFLHARPRHGTFVTDHPPHLCHYGLIIQHSVPQNLWWQRSQFHYALELEATALSRRDHRKILSFFIQQGAPPNDETRLRLDACVRNERLAGLILLNPYTPLGNDLLRTARMPCVVFGDTADIPGALRVHLDPHRFIDRGLDALKAHGCRRIAMIAAATTSSRRLDYLARAAASRGLKTEPAWIQGIGLQHSQWARHAIRAVMSPGANRRPDGILVTDEHLVEPTLAGLHEERLHPGVDVEVIGHCSFHGAAPPALPVRRLGYAAKDLLGLAIDLIDRKRLGEPVPESVTVDPLLESELPTVDGEQ